MMEKIKALLLPLALVFAAIAVFEFGARYGATNMRAYAIAEQIQLRLDLAPQVLPPMSDEAKANYLILIDHNIAKGALHRNIWHLDKKASAALDKVLAYALSIRGDAVTERFASMEASEELPALNKAKLSEIRQAVIDAKTELVDNAPSVAEKEAAE